MGINIMRATLTFCIGQGRDKVQRNDKYCVLGNLLLSTNIASSVEGWDSWKELAGVDYGIKDCHRFGINFVIS